MSRILFGLLVLTFSLPTYAETSDPHPADTKAWAHLKWQYPCQGCVCNTVFSEAEEKTFRERGFVQVFRQGACHEKEGKGYTWLSPKDAKRFERAVKKWQDRMDKRAEAWARQEEQQRKRDDKALKRRYTKAGASAFTLLPNGQIQDNVLLRCTANGAESFEGITKEAFDEWLRQWGKRK